MNIIFFSHPNFSAHQSMPRYVQLLAAGMEKRGHKIQIWSPKAYFCRLTSNPKLQKWLGYIDQYLVFPLQVRNRITQYNASDTLYVFTDHALGPWVPIVSKKPHVIHCHDFLAQRSAQNEISQNPTSFTGKQYQKFIRNGYQQGKNFISVSLKTKEDLHRFLKFKPTLSVVIYNALNQPFKPLDVKAARNLVSTQFNHDLNNGYLLHVGGNQWYKNRTGVIAIYEAWRSIQQQSKPLLLIGPKPNQELLAKWNQSPFKKDILLLSGISDELVRTAYSGASIFLFPSLAEGFGWPIAESMASGSLVITTDEAPMNEVGGDAAFYVPKQPAPMGDGSNIIKWAHEVAILVDKILHLPTKELEAKVTQGIENAQRFAPEPLLDEIETVYRKVLNTF